MKRVRHPSVVRLKDYFYAKGEKSDDVFLHLVMPYIPETIYSTLRTHTKAKRLIPTKLVKVVTYTTRITRILSYIRVLCVCVCVRVCVCRCTYIKLPELSRTFIP